MFHMKYSSNNLHEPGITLPLKFKVKVLVEYRPAGRPIEFAPMVFTTDPEAAADEIVRTKGWDQLPDYKPSDVWVDGGI
jgi:hypothetical protein